jgi:hypothetical protein
MIMFLFLFSVSMLSAYGIDALARLRERSKRDRRQKVIRGLLIAAAAVTVVALLFSVAGSALMGVYTSIFYPGISADNFQAAEANIPTITLSLWLIAIWLWVVFWLARSHINGRVGRVALAALVLICLIDLWRVDFGFIDTADYRRFFPEAPVLKNLRSLAEPARVFDLSRQTFSSRDYFALHGIEQITGYHGAQLKTFDEYIGGLSYSRLTGPQGIELRPFQLANTKYLILDAGRQMNEALGLKKIYEQEVTVYELPRVMRRASIYHAYRIGSGDESDLDLLFSEDFPAPRMLILYEEPEHQPVLPDSGVSETVEIVTHDVNYQKYDVNLAAAGLLFISDNYFPGWKVKVDGVDKKLLRANHTFRAVSLDEGAHEVELYWQWQRYETSKLVTWLTAAFSLIVLLGCLVVERLRGGGRDD